MTNNELKDRIRAAVVQFLSEAPAGTADELYLEVEASVGTPTDPLAVETHITLYYNT